jgi:hypothetical protein
MLHWFKLNCPCFMQPSASWKVIKEANTIFWLQCVGTWDTCFSHSTPFLLISNNLKHNGRRTVIKAKSYFSKETRQLSNNWDYCCADHNDHSEHDMYVRVPSRHHRACSVFEKLCSWTCPLSSRIWGLFQSVCTIFENVTSVCTSELIQHLEPHEQCCMKFNVCEDHTKLSVHYHFVYCRTNTTDTLQETYVHFWAHFQANHQNTWIRK